MKKVRQSLGGIGNLMFQRAFLVGMLNRGQIPDVYVQNFEYWKDSADVVKQMFSHGITGGIPKVALQIRLGDYMQSNGFYTDLTKTHYYQNAIAHFPDKEFLVFCHDGQDPRRDAEDKERAAAFLDTIIPGRYTLWKPMSETDDLNTMASCEHAIIANSSFGIWAGYLNPNPNKIVICPPETRYYSDGVIRTKFPPEFTQIGLA